MGAKLWRLAADAVWWISELLVSMLLGALVVGVGGFVLGLLADGVGASGALQIGALVGAGLGAIVAFGPGFASYGPREMPDSRSAYKPGERDGRPR